MNRAMSVPGFLAEGRPPIVGSGLLVFSSSLKLLYSDRQGLQLKDCLRVTIHALCDELMERLVDKSTVSLLECRRVCQLKEATFKIRGIASRSLLDARQIRIAILLEHIA